MGTVGQERADRGRSGYARPIGELLFSPWILVPLALVVGSFVAYQFFHLTPRYIKLAFGILFLIAVIRLPFHLAVTVMVLIFPIPTFIFLGDTNILFIGVLAVLWLIRVRTGAVPRPIRGPIDWAVWIYLGIHYLSLINVQTDSVLAGARDSLAFMTAAAILYFLLYNAIRTEKHLSILIYALCATAFFVDITALAEHYFGFRVVPTWFIYAPATVSRFEEGGRAGGVFGFHGLLADFSAMNFYLQVALGMRSRRRTAKIFFYGLAALSILNILNSSNRGGAILWGIGGILFLWFHRHRIRWSRVAILSPVVLLLGALASALSETLLYRITLFGRLAQTQFQRGIPENRVEVWARILEEIRRRPWLGHGPYIELQPGAVGRLYWPHNAYLFYLYTVGIPGLLAFLWILLKAVWLSRPRSRVDFARGSLSRAVQAIFHIQIIQFALGQLRDEHQRGNVYVYWMWIVIAVALIATRLVREGERGARSARPTPHPH